MCIWRGSCFWPGVRSSSGKNERCTWRYRLPRRLGQRQLGTGDILRQRPPHRLIDGLKNQLFVGEFHLQLCWVYVYIDCPPG